MKTDQNDKILEGELLPVNDGGRPSKCTEDAIKTAAELMSQGRTNAQICAELGISERTFYRWKKDHKEFQEMLELTAPQKEAHWDYILEGVALGKIKNANTTALLAHLNKMFNGAYREKKEESIQQINIENMQVLQGIQQLDDAELDAKIQAALTKYEGTKADDDDYRSEEN